MPKGQFSHMWTDDMRAKISAKNPGVGHPRSAETRRKIGAGSRATRLAEVRPCPYECGISGNAGVLARHVRSTHEFVCAYPDCKVDKHKGNGFCQQHQSGHVLLRRYGLTYESYNALWDSQDGACAICGSFGGKIGDYSVSRTKTLLVDHCHSSGRIRGLLCFLCNVGLGHFGDDTARMQRAISYLTEHSS